MHNDHLYGVQGYRGSISVDLSKGIVVCPLLYFYFSFSLFSIFFLYFLWPQWLFLFNSHLSSLGSFDFVHFGIFSSLRGHTLYITKSIDDLSHFTKYSNHKENVTIMMYANVCLCQCSRICNDTSASCSND